MTATAGTGVITVTGATISAAQASCTVTVDVTSNTAGTYNNTNAANISATQRVDTTGVNSTLTVQALPTLTKAFSPTTVGVGQNSVLTFTITNPAGAPARTGLTFTDTLPAGAVIGTPNGLVNGCGGTPTITATAGTGVLHVGGTGVNAAIGASTCTITVNVTSSDRRCLRERRGPGHGHRRDAQRGDEPDAHGDASRPSPRPSRRRRSTPTATSTLTFTVTNGAGNPAQTEINFVDTLPAKG